MSGKTRGRIAAGQARLPTPSEARSWHIPYATRVMLAAVCSTASVVANDCRQRGRSQPSWKHRFSCISSSVVSGNRPAAFPPACCTCWYSSMKVDGRRLPSRWQCSSVSPSSPRRASPSSSIGLCKTKPTGIREIASAVLYLAEGGAASSLVSERNQIDTLRYHCLRDLACRPCQPPPQKPQLPSDIPLRCAASSGRIATEQVQTFQGQPTW